MCTLGGPLFTLVCALTYPVRVVPHHIVHVRSFFMCESSPLSLGHLVGLIHRLEVLINLLANCSLGFLSVLFARLHSQCLVWWPAILVHICAWHAPVTSCTRLCIMLSLLLSPHVPETMYICLVCSFTSEMENLAYVVANLLVCFVIRSISFSNLFY